MSPSLFLAPRIMSLERLYTKLYSPAASQSSKCLLPEFSALFPLPEVPTAAKSKPTEPFHLHIRTGESSVPTTNQDPETAHSQILFLLHSLSTPHPVNGLHRHFTPREPISQKKTDLSKKQSQILSPRCV